MEKDERFFYGINERKSQSKLAKQASFISPDLLEKSKGFKAWLAQEEIKRIEKNKRLEVDLNRSTAIIGHDGQVSHLAIKGAKK